MSKKQFVVTVTATPELKSKLKEIAVREKRSLSAQLWYIVEQYLKQHEHGKTLGTNNQ
jgi:predicted transcriptional regulator